MTPPSPKSASSSRYARDHGSADESSAEAEDAPSDRVQALERLKVTLRGGPDEDLIRWAAELEDQNRSLHKEIRKQDMSFATLFEIISQIGVRSFDLYNMQAYIINTLRGQFSFSKVVLYRPQELDDKFLRPVEVQGLGRARGLTNVFLPLVGRFSDHLRSQNAPVRLDAGSSTELDRYEEIQKLKQAGLSILLPLVLTQEDGETSLEGLLGLGGRLSDNPFSETDLKLLQMLGKMIAVSFHNEQLYRRSIIDDLTRVSSRGHFEGRLNQEVNRINRYGKGSLGLVMLDVDNFKRVNDQYGHPVGDQVLREIGELLKGSVRDVDSVARYGGEEFAIVLIEIDKSLAVEVSERIRAAIETHVVRPRPNLEVRITASLGVAACPEDSRDRSELVSRADQALYRSKERGRNRVTVA